MSTMSDTEFQKHVESGQLPVDSHDKLLRYAHVFMFGRLSLYWEVFVVIEKLHARGLSFGKGDLRFNRTLDVFYLAQITAGVYRSTNSFDDDVPEETYYDNFDPFYAEHHDLLHEDAWKEYYTPSFLAQPLSARFWRLPNLRDLTDTSDQLRGVRREGTGNFTKLPRWAYLVATTRRRQPALSAATIAQIAVSTLQETTSRQRKDHPGVQPYSETQTRFWLKRMGVYSTASNVRLHEQAWDLYHLFGTYVAQGRYDVRAWEAHYSPERWESTDAQTQLIEPDLDGTRKSVVQWCGWPDGGVMGEICGMGWEEELGSEEEIAFLAAVAAKEVEAVAVDGADELNYAIRSHMLLGVLRAAFETDRARHVDDLKQRITDAGRLDDDKIDPWIEKALELMEPYVAGRPQGPAGAEGWSELLRQVLEENGQLFGRWKQSGSHINGREALAFAVAVAAAFACEASDSIPEATDHFSNSEPIEVPDGEVYYSGMAHYDRGPGACKEQEDHASAESTIIGGDVWHAEDKEIQHHGCGKINAS